jgi:hypothetical protein
VEELSGNENHGDTSQLDFLIFRIVQRLERSECGDHAARHLHLPLALRDVFVRDRHLMVRCGWINGWIIKQQRKRKPAT